MKENGWFAYYKQQFGLWLAPYKLEWAKRVSLLTPKFPPPPRPTAPPPAPIPRGDLPKGIRIIQLGDKFVAQHKGRHGWRSLDRDGATTWDLSGTTLNWVVCNTQAQALKLLESHILIAENSPKVVFGS